jgi:hypothetical protein
MDGVLVFLPELKPAFCISDGNCCSAFKHRPSPLLSECMGAMHNWCE